MLARLFRESGYRKADRAVSLCVRSCGYSPPDRYACWTKKKCKARPWFCDLEKIVAIGEIGLDYYWDKEGRDVQKKWFVVQIKPRQETDLPVIVHSRDAAKDTLDIMKAERADYLRGVIHCYSYSKEQAREYMNMGYFLGIGGVVTFKNGKKLKEVVEYAPLDYLLLETDAPYLAPEPHRGAELFCLFEPMWQR